MMKSLGFRGLIFISLAILFLWALSGVIMMSRIQISQPIVHDNERLLRILIRTGTEASALRKIAETFESQSGIKVEFVELGRDNYFTVLGTQLFAGSNSFDILFMPNTSIAQFASVKALLPLDPLIENPEFTDLEQFDLSDFLAVYRYRDAIYALPTDISTHFLYYRSDLILEPPATWEQYFDTAVQLSRSASNSSPTRWGAVMPAVVPEERSKIFASLLWSFGGDILDAESERVSINSEASIRAGHFLAELVKHQAIPDDLLTWDFSRTRDALLNGDVAMAAPFWNAAYQDIMESTSPFKDQIKIALIPGIEDANGEVQRVPFQHSWTLAINANSASPAEAWEFVKYATGKDGGRQYADAGGIPARRSILNDGAYASSRPDFALLLQSVETARNEPNIPFYNAMVDIEERALAKIITLYENPESALNAAAAELNELLQSIH